MFGTTRRKRSAASSIGHRSAAVLVSTAMLAAVLVGVGPVAPAAADPSGSIAGQVTSGDPSDVHAAWLIDPLTHGSLASTLVEDDGTYLLDGIEPGEYLVGFTAHNPGTGLPHRSDELYPGSHDRQTATLVEVAGGPVTGIDASLDPRGEIEGKVVAAGSPSTPIRGAIVYATPHDDTPSQEPIAAALTDDQGFFAVSTLDVGRYDLMVDRDLDGEPEATLDDVDAGVGLAASFHQIDVALPAGLPFGPPWMKVTPGFGSVEVEFAVPLSGPTPTEMYVVVVPAPGALGFHPELPLAGAIGLANGRWHQVGIAFGNATGIGQFDTESVLPTGCSNTWFTDVGATSAFCPHIRWLAATGITTGYDDYSFRPTSSVSREAFAAFLYRAAGSPDGEDPACASPPFSDIAITHPFCGEITWLVDQGISAGFPDDTFRGVLPVSRQAMAAFLNRFVEGFGGDDFCTGAEFTDVPLSHPFCPEIEWMASTGLSTGYPDGSFRPVAPVSREAMAAFLYRLDEMSPLPVEMPDGGNLLPAAGGAPGSHAAGGADADTTAPNEATTRLRPTELPRPHVARVPIG